MDVSYLVEGLGNGLRFGVVLCFHLIAMNAGCSSPHQPLHTPIRREC